MRYTADELKQMNAQDFTKATSILPMEMRLKLAILAGAGDKGVQVYEGKDMSSGSFYQEKIDYDELATVLSEVEKNG